jgi:hypothetical protein
MSDPREKRSRPPPIGASGLVRLSYLEDEDDVDELGPTALHTNDGADGAARPRLPSVSEGQLPQYVFKGEEMRAVSHTAKPTRFPWLFVSVCLFVIAAGLLVATFVVLR